MHAKAALVSLSLAASVAGGPVARAQGVAPAGAPVVGTSPAGISAVNSPSPAAPAASSARRTAATLQSIVEEAESREPSVQHNVFEDGGSKVDELVVRGEVQHVVVTPKVGTTRSYEIIVQRGGRTPPDSTGGASSAVGKRVWNVLAF